MERIKVILANYDEEGLQLFKDSVNELFAKGFAKGCYQDYGVITDISRILTICEDLIKKGLNKNSNEEKVRSESDIAKEVLQILHELGGCDATDEWDRAGMQL